MSSSTRKYRQKRAGAIIVAAGTSKRMGGVDKVMASLGGKPVLVRVIDAFQKCRSIDQIVVVLGKQNLAEVRRLVLKEGCSEKIDLCFGQSLIISTPSFYMNQF